MITWEQEQKQTGTAVIAAGPRKNEVLK